MISSLFKLPVLFSLIVGGLGDTDCPLDRKLPSDRQRVINDIFCGYDKTVRPVKLRTDIVSVAVKMTPIFINYEIEYHAFGIHADLQWVWKDEFLTWDPAKYGGVKVILVHNEEIWKPQIYHVSAYDWYLDDLSQWSTICSINSEGWVNCSSDPMMWTMCFVDLTDWPYDYQNCSLKISSIVDTEEKVDLMIMETHLNSMYISAAEWELVDMTAKKGQYIVARKVADYIEYSFLSRRRGAISEAVVVFPLIVLAILTLSTFWFGEECEARMNVCFCVFICHIMMLLDLLHMKNGTNAPSLLIFFNYSLLLCIIALVLAIIIQWIRSDPPLMIPSIISSSLDHLSTRMLFFSERKKHFKGSALLEEEQEENGTEDTMISVGSRDWNLISAVIDRFAFIIFCLIYLILGIRSFM